MADYILDIHRHALPHPSFCYSQQADVLGTLLSDVIKHALQKKISQ